MSSENSGKTRAAKNPTVSASGSPKVPATTSLACLFTWIGTRGDYSSIERRDKALKGWRRQFSNVTFEGRFNIVIATWVTTAIAGFYAWRWHKSKEAKNVHVDK